MRRGVVKILTIKEVSERTRVPEATLRWWRHNGTEGPRSFKLGRRVVYSEDDVEGWLREQYETTSTTREAV